MSTLKIYVGAIAVLIILVIGTQGGDNISSVSYTPPTAIPVRMYRLDANGNIYYQVGTPFPCATPDNQRRWGCTAFDQDNTRNLPTPVTPVPYPYGATPVPNVALESDYLPDVVAEEMPIDAFHPLALQVQAITSRSYAAYKNLAPGSSTPTPTPMDNSTANQAFIPYRFEFLRAEGGDYAHNPTTTPTPNPLDCTTIPGDNAARYQRKLCYALTPVQGRYLSKSTEDSPIFAEFFADVQLHTTTHPQQTPYPYLLGVEDPISTVPPATNDGHGRGLSQYGASRWARGNTYGNINYAGVPWSVRWDRVEQILVHYYTGIHLRDANGTSLTTYYRWNPLQINWGTPDNRLPAMYHGGSYPISIQVQNTGIDDWNCTYPNFSYELRYRWARAGHEDVTGSSTVTVCGQTKGDPSPMKNLTISDIPNWGPGAYTLRFDIYVTSAYGNFWFGEYWPSYDVQLCVDGPCKVFLPLVLKNYSGW